MTTPKHSPFSALKFVMDEETGVLYGEDQQGASYGFEDSDLLEIERRFNTYKILVEALEQISKLGSQHNGEIGIAGDIAKAALSLSLSLSGKGRKMRTEIFCSHKYKEEREGCNFNKCFVCGYIWKVGEEGPKKVVIGYFEMNCGCEVNHQMHPK